ALTFVYAAREHFAARICMGAATGLALMATIGFVLASFLGMTRTTVAMAAGFLALPSLLLLNHNYRNCILTEIKTTAQSFLAAVNRPDWTKAAYAGFYLFIAVLLGLVFGRAVFEK